MNDGANPPSLSPRYPRSGKRSLNMPRSLRSSLLDLLTRETVGCTSRQRAFLPYPNRSMEHQGHCRPWSSYRASSRRTVGVPMSCNVNNISTRGVKNAMNRYVLARWMFLEFGIPRAKPNIQSAPRPTLQGEKGTYQSKVNLLFFTGTPKPPLELESLSLRYVQLLLTAEHLQNRIIHLLRFEPPAYKMSWRPLHEVNFTANTLLEFIRPVELEIE